MKVYGNLERASVENVGALPTAGIKGRMVFLTTDSKFYMDDGSAYKEVGYNPNTTAGDVIVHNGTSNVRLPIGTDNQTIVVDTTQTNKLKWATLPQGAKNYVTYNNFENNAITGWNEISATYSSNTPSGTPTISSSAAANLTIAASATTPLAGTYSMLATLTAPSAGVGFCTDALTLDREDRAKVLQWSFYYEVKSGSGDFSGTSANTFSVWILQDNGSTLTWTQPAGVYNMVQSSGAGIGSGTFQTNSDTTTVRLVVFVNTSATISVAFDDFALSPVKAVTGAAMSDWEDFTPSIIGITGTYNIAKKRRVGSNIELNIKVTLTAAFSAIVRVNMPSGITFDTTKWQAGGTALLTNSGGAGTYQGILLNDAGNALLIMADSNSTYWQNGAANPRTTVSGDVVYIQVSLPVVSWSSNTVQSSDVDSRVCVARYSTASTQSIADNTNVVMNYDVMGFDSHGAVTTGVSWKFTAPVSGYYNVSAGFVLTASASWGINERPVLFVLKNGTTNVGTLYVNWQQAAVTQYVGGTGSTIVQLNAGDYIQIILSQNSGSSITLLSDIMNAVSINRLSGPATIQASETVAARITSTTTAITAASVTTLASWSSTKTYDSHGAWDTATGIYTITVSGKYRISSAIAFGSTAWTAGTNRYIALSVAGTKTAQIASFQVWASVTQYSFLAGSTEFNYNAGDTVSLTVSNQAGSGTVTPNGVASECWATITRVGN